jgi:iron complex outermembrane recepter protein
MIVEKVLTHLLEGCVTVVARLFHMCSRLVHTPHVVAMVCGVIPMSLAVGAVEQKRSYNLPQDDATVTLNKFAEISGSQIVFMLTSVRGVRTNAVTGEYTSTEALTRMLAGTELRVTQNTVSGAYVVTRRRASEAGRVGPDSRPETKPNNMNKPSISMIKRAVALLGLLVAQVSEAQTSSPPAVAKNEDTIELSPFVVSASSEQGYVAASSLAGSRVNTPLKDIAAQIDVLTSEFINDIGAVNVEEAIVYSTNNGGANEQNTGVNDGTQSTRTSGRARGFDASTASSDFYATSMPSDFYNVDRLTIANGPQSILFGLGNAGGAVDTTTKRATMRDRYQIGFRADLEGSARTSFDLNEVIIPQKLAIRIVGLKSDANEAVQGGYNNQERLFGTFTLKPTPSTTVRISGERVLQRASLATNRLSYDFVTPWLAAGSPLYDNSRGNASITNTTFLLLSRNSSTQRTTTYDGLGNNNIYVWNGSALTRGPHQLTGAVDTRTPTLFDPSIYPLDRDPRIEGRMNKLGGKMVRGSIEQKITQDLYLELGFNYESIDEIRGGPFTEAEAASIRVDPNMYLPGGTAAVPQTKLNPNAGKLYIEGFPRATELTNLTKETRLSFSYEFNFAKRFGNFTRFLGRHRFAGLVSSRIDEDLSQDSRVTILGNPSFATGDLLNNSRLTRVRYYLNPSVGSYSAGGIPGGPDGMFGSWSNVDATTGETFQTTTFGNPAGRTSPAAGSRKEIQTYMLALQSFFWNDRVNFFAGRRIDDFKSYLMADQYLVRGDQLVAGDRKGLYTPLPQTDFAPTPSLDDRGITYSYGTVVHAWRGLSFFASKSNNTGLPPGRFDPDNNPLRGVYSDGYDYGFRTSLRNDTISMRVNFYKEHQHNLIGDGQNVRTSSALIEQRLRGSDRPAGIADVAADGYDPVGRGDVYRSVEDKIGRGIDVTLVARLTKNWDMRLALGRQQTRVFNKGADFTAWVNRRLPVWQNFGGLGWDNVTISTTDPRTVHEYYTQQVLSDITTNQLRNNLPRYRQREWRASLFTDYNFSEGRLKGLNFGGGVRWTDSAMIGFEQRPFPTGGNGDDVTKPIFGDAQTFVDLLAGYGSRAKIFGGHPINWRVQVNVRNLLEPKKYEPVRSSWTGSVLEWARVEPRSVTMNVTFTY